MTIKDIARISGYGVSTVSRALNGHPDICEETRKKIEQVVKEYGFVPNSNARRLKQTAGKNVLVIVKGTSNMFFPSVVEEMQSAAERQKINLAFHYIDERADEVADAIRLENEHKPLGIIFLGGNAENFKNKFSVIAAPSVLCTVDGSELDFSNLSSVSVNDIESGFAAVDYLFDCGHKKIGFIGGSEVGSYPASKRFRGSIEAMEKRGVEYKSEYFVPARFSLESGYNAAKELLNRQNGITAIFAMSDIMAIGAMRAILDMGYRIPEDCSIIGFDGIPMTEFLNPRLTTLKQPVKKLAEISVDLLTNLMENSKNEHITLPARLIDGGSVRK